MTNPPAPDDEPHVCKPGATTYYCPQAGEIESDCHGGFDVCCARPDLHVPDARLHDRLTELRALNDGWLDGYGKAPADNVIDFAGRLVTTLPRDLDPILVTPTEEGGVQLEWSDQHGGHEIEIMPDLHLFLLTVEPGETS